MTKEFKHFNVEEFKCRHCGKNLIDHDFVRLLDRIRSTYYNKPLVVTSGYRCPEHDKAVGGKGNHPTGLAADLLVPKGADMYDFIKAAQRVGIPRLVLYKTKPHIHIDIREDRPRGVFVCS